MSGRILHVIDGIECGDCTVLACADSIAASDGRDGAAFVGSTAGHAHAGSLGLASVRLSAPGGVSSLAWRALRGLLRDGGYDAVVPWGDRAVGLCRLALRGIPASSPSIDRARINERCDGGPTREAIRQQLGVADESPVVALLGDPPRASDARRFVHLIGVLDVGETAVSGVIDHRAAHLGRARRYHAEAGVRWPMLVVQKPLITLMRGVDLAAIVEPEPRRELRPSERRSMHLAVWLAHAHGVPVVGDPRWLGDDLCPADARTALVAQGAGLVPLVRKLTSLTHDPDERAALGASVREHVLRTREDDP